MAQKNRSRPVPPAPPSPRDSRPSRTPLSPGLSLADLSLALLFGTDAPRVARTIRRGVITMIATALMTAAALMREWRPGAAPGSIPLADSIRRQALEIPAAARAALAGLTTDSRFGERVILLALGWLILLWMFRVLDNGCRPWPMAVERLLDVGTAPVLVFCALSWPLAALSLGSAHAAIGLFHRRATPALRLQLHRWRARAGDEPPHRR